MYAFMYILIVYMSNICRTMNVWIHCMFGIYVFKKNSEICLFFYYIFLYIFLIYSEICFLFMKYF